MQHEDETTRFMADQLVKTQQRKQGSLGFDSAKSESPRRTCGSWLLYVPAGTMAVGLGSVGGGSVACLVLDHLEVGKQASALTAVPFFATSAVLLLISWLHLLALFVHRRKTFLSLLYTPAAISAHSTGLIAAPLLTASVYRVLKDLSVATAETVGVAKVFIFFGSAAYAVGLVWWLHVVWKRRLLPEPIWFPPTVAIAVLTLATGSLYAAEPSLTMHSGLASLMEAGFWAGLGMTIVTLPVAYYRCAIHDDVAANSTVFILLAPASFCGIALWSLLAAVPRRFLSPVLYTSVPHVVVAISQFVMWSSLMLGWLVKKRRTALLSNLFHHTWGPFTFPFLSTASTMLSYYKFAETDENSSEGYMVALRYYALCAAIAILVQTVLVVGTHVVQLPKWVREAQNAETKLLAEEKLLGFQGPLDLQSH